MSELGIAVKQAREKGYLMREIAAVCDVNRTTIYQWVRDGNCPDESLAIQRLWDLPKRSPDIKRVKMQSEIQRLVKDLQQRRWTMRGIARELGVSGNAVSLWMKGKHLPHCPDHTIKALREILDKP